MLSRSLLIFPTNRSIREYIRQNKLCNQFLPKMITIGELFNRIIIPPKNKLIVDSDLRIIYLQKAIKKLNFKKLGLSDDFAKLYTQGEYIFKFFNELNSEFKTIEDLIIYDSYSFYEEHLRILRAIYDNYKQILEEKNAFDRIILPENFSINKDFLEVFSNIELYYEGYFSAFEFYLIEELAKIIPLSLYCTINKFNQKNIELFSKIKLELEMNYQYELDISNAVIIKKNRLESKAIEHNIYPVSSRLLQLGMIKYSIVSMIKEGINPSNIVLVTPDEQFSQWIKIFDDEKYCNFAMGMKINQLNIYQYAHAIRDYLNIDEPKNKEKIKYFLIDEVYIDEKIKPLWNKKIDKECFIELLDFILQQEKNKEILEKFFEIKVLLESMLALVEIDDNVRFKDGFEIFLKKLEKIVLDDTNGGKITVVGILETRAMEYEGVIVIDFNDNIVPKRSIKDKYLSTSIKKYSKLPTLEDRENLQKYYYQRLFQNAKKVHISYVADKEHTASRFLNELFEKQNIIDVDFTDILKQKKEIFIDKKKITKEINLSTLRWSATSLKIFLECKRRYYFQYILKINQHEIALKPKGYEIGNIIHNILEKIFKNNKFTIEEMKNELSKYQNTNPYLTIELELWKKQLEMFFQNEQQRFQSGIRIHALEEPFLIQINNITLQGKIDRIDKLVNGTFAIIDYKTSTSLKIDSIKNYEDTTDFQLEFYFLATKHLGVSMVGYYDLNDGKIKEELVLEQKLKKLDEILKSLQTTIVDFEMCSKKQICEFCPYKVMCNRD